MPHQLQPLHVSEREERRVPSPKKENKKIRRAVTSITFMDHITLNIFTWKKKGMIVTRQRTTKASISPRREEAILERIKAINVANGFI